MSRRRTYRSAPAEIVKEKPTKRARVESHVVVPILFSLALGFAVGLLLWWVKSEHAVTVGIGVFVVVMVLFLLNYMPSLLERETVSSGEGDDEYTAEQRVTLDIKHWSQEEQLRGLQFIVIPDGLEIGSVLAWAKAAVRGESLAVNNWTGFRRPFTRSQYEQWMDQLIGHTLVQDLGGNKGRVLTRSGKAVFKKLIEELG